MKEGVSYDAVLVLNSAGDRERERVKIQHLYLSCCGVSRGGAGWFRRRFHFVGHLRELHFIIHHSQGPVRINKQTNKNNNKQTKSHLTA